MSNRFSVPFSSSPPATPDKLPPQSSNNATRVSPAFSFADPSTTPAGPPPSSTKSFTPAGQPPVSVFGSSQFPTSQLGSVQTGSRNLFAQWKPESSSLAGSGPAPPSFASSPLKFSTVGAGQGGFSFGDTMKSSTGPTAMKNNFGFSYADTAHEDDEEEEEDADGETDDMDVAEEEHEIEEDEYEEEVEEEGEDDYMDEGSEEDQPPPPRNLKASADLLGMSPGWGLASTTSAAASGTPRGKKRTRGNEAPSHPIVSLRKDSTIPKIAKSMSQTIEPADIEEPDDMILSTEDCISALYRVEDPHELLSEAVDQLLKTWERSSNEIKRNDTRQEYTVTIGPHEGSSPIVKANFVTSLYLPLHHPPPYRPHKQGEDFRMSIPPSLSDKTQTIPQVLFNWVNASHNPFGSSLLDVRVHLPNPAAHLNFWDVIFSALLRGKIKDVIILLKLADFQQARTAEDDGHRDGYRGLQLGNIQRVINRAIQALEMCPAISRDDWDIRGGDWQIFRRRIDQAVEDLSTFAEGGNRDTEVPEDSFTAENFGISKPSLEGSMTEATRRAESRVPWTIYQNLRAMYGILRGGATEIMPLSQDWLEATIALTAWWNGDDDEVDDLRASRRSHRASRSRHVRLVDVNPTAGYFQRLSTSFNRVTDDSDVDSFKINTLNPVEVCLASTFQSGVESVLGFLQGWSLTIASATAEIARLGGWFESPPAGRKLIDNFDETDFMVLSYNKEKKGLSKDTVLIEYAERLFYRENLKKRLSNTVVEGWQLTLQILGRLDNPELAKETIADFLDELPLESEDRVNQILDLCNSLSLDRQGEAIAEKYADNLASTTQNYGSAMLYYARAHNLNKLKSVLDLLTSFCLVHSISYPPPSSLDAQLKNLVFSPQDALMELSRIDMEAAEMVQTYLSGYATLRKFYDLRDADVNPKEGEKTTSRPAARKREAATALIALITSAAENIRGGLYDPECDAVLQVDGLLCLLGESLLFVNQTKPLLNAAQLHAILAAIEDLQTVTPLVYAQCEEFFRATIAASTSMSSSSMARSYAAATTGRQRGATGSRSMLKSQTSSGLTGMTGTSGFSLLEQSMYGGSIGVGSMESSGVLVGSEILMDAKRGWDWRAGLRKDAKGEEILRVLRLGIAKELARVWVASA